MYAYVCFHTLSINHLNIMFCLKFTQQTRKSIRNLKSSNDEKERQEQEVKKIKLRGKRERAIVQTALY